MTQKWPLLNPTPKSFQAMVESFQRMVSSALFPVFLPLVEQKRRLLEKRLPNTTSSATFGHYDAPIVCTDCASPTLPLRMGGAPDNMVTHEPVVFRIVGV